ncbi:MAG TPA: YdcF family protein [Terriglobales bacterium]|nr:YdcF family protein [Terriglobales bacterium]
MRSDRGGAISKFIALLFLFLLCVGLYLVRRPLLQMIGEAWIVEDPLRKSDAIIVLGDDFYADRSTLAAQLYRQGLAPVVVASGEQVRPGASIAELMAHDLFERGIPKDKIVQFPQSADSTAGEARALERFASEKKWRSVILVTSNYDSRRARYIFRRVFPAKVSVGVAGAQDAQFDPAHWYEKRNSIKRFILEMGGMAEALWEFRHQGDSHLGTLWLVERPAWYLRYVV